MGVTKLGLGAKIAVFIGNYEGAYPRGLRKGMIEAARKHHVQVIFYAGKSINHPDETQQNSIYRLINIERIDGIIIASGAISDFCSRADLIAFAESFQGFPLVSLNVQLKNITSIIVDNREGMGELMDHLILQHGYRRIAFIKGTDDSQEAIERFEAYQNALIRHGIEWCPEWILPGDFQFVSGAEAVKTLLDQRGLTDIEAIIGGNDASAYGALQELEKRGIRVPEDMALAGFDDADETEFNSTPLTTVSQNIFTQGYQAVEVLIEKIAGKKMPHVVKVPSSLVIRESCGCPPGAGLSILMDRAERTFSLPQDNGLQSMLTMNMLKEVPENLQKIFNVLKDGLQEDIGNENKAHCFIDALEQILPNKPDTLREIQTIQGMVWLISRWLTHQYPQGIPNFLIILLQKAQMRIGTALRRQEALKRIDTNDILNCIRRFNSKMNNAFADLNGLMDYLCSELPALGISTCLIAMYKHFIQGDSGGLWEFPKDARLIMAYRNGFALDVPDDFSFDTSLLIPDTLWPENSIPLLLMPLVSRDKHFGIMMVDAGQSHSMLYDILREQISNSIYTLELYRELQEQSLRDDLTGIYNRRGFFVQGESYSQRAFNEEQSFYVIFGDLDDLKQINDQYGHREGDVALRVTAALLRQIFHEEDVIARLGGDEFAVLTRASSRQTPEMIKKKVDEAFSRNSPSSIEKPYKLAISIGVVPYLPRTSQSLESLLIEADRKQYEEKKRRKRKKTRANMNG